MSSLVTNIYSLLQSNLYPAAINLGSMILAISLLNLINVIFLLITIFKNYERRRLRRKVILRDVTNKHFVQMKLNQSISIGPFGQRAGLQNQDDLFYQPNGLQDNQDNELMQNTNNDQNINIEMSEKSQKVDIK